ncbi:MAG: hypothetical protein ACR2LJ_12100 [Acidimicrobiales bacterium]
MPAGLATPAAIVAALEAQRGQRLVAVYWRELLLHGVAADAYLYINDPTKTDLDVDERRQSTDKALAAMKLTETWHKGDPRPELPNFESVSQELATRAQRSAGVEMLASNAARSTEGPEQIDVVVVYRPTYADGSTDRTSRLVVVLDTALKITNAYYF